MENILKSIEKSLDDKNWYGALILSLILPDICAKVEGSTKCSSERYLEWFEKYLGTKYYGFLSGHDCYAFRCSLLHEGHGNIEERSASDKQRQNDVLHRFEFIDNGPHCNLVSNCHFGDPKYDGKNILQLSVKDFCQDMIGAAKEWLNDSAVIKDLSEMLVIHEKEFSIGSAIKFGQ